MNGINDSKTGKFLKGHKVPWAAPNKGTWEKGSIPWNKGLMGYGKGRITSEETKEKLRIINMGKGCVERVELLCNYCGNLVKRKKSEIGKHVFCNRKCSFEWRKTNDFKEEHSIKTSEAQKKLWKNKKHKNLMINVRKKVWNNLEFREKMKKAQAIAWDNPNRRIKARLRMIGNKHPNWKGGKSKEEYGAKFDSFLKEHVRLRDEYKCKICGVSQLENGKQLDIHHKDTNKRNNKIDNLIALCRSCHIRTHWENQRKEKKCA